MGNNKISITAELVSIIRSKDDYKNLYFVSPNTRKIYNFIKRFVSEDKLEEIFDWRLRLSKIFDDKILIDKPEQIIEFGAGYSLRGFNLCIKNSGLVYIDSDFDDVIIQKTRILEIICKKENIIFPENYHLVGIDALKDDFFEKTENVLSRKRKLLAIAEGLTSYFDNAELGVFLKKISDFLSRFPNGEFHSHESVSRPSGFVYTVLRLFISLITKSKSHNKFKSATQFEAYLKRMNITNIKIDDSKQGFLFYSLFRN